MNDCIGIEPDCVAILLADLLGPIFVPAGSLRVADHPLEGGAGHFHGFGVSRQVTGTAQGLGRTLSPSRGRSDRSSGFRRITTRLIRRSAVIARYPCASPAASVHAAAEGLTSVWRFISPYATFCKRDYPSKAGVLIDGTGLPEKRARLSDCRPSDRSKAANRGSARSSSKRGSTPMKATRGECS